MADEKIALVPVRNKSVIIYGLIDPRDGLIRYIGKTESITVRLRGHVCDARKTDSDKARWIKELLALGLLPTVLSLEIVPVEASWEEAEKRHIAEYKARGVVLLNRTGGGQGVPDTSRTDEWKRKGVESRRANPAYWEAVMAAAARRKGIPLTPEHKASIGAAKAGKKYPPEFGAKISAAQKGRAAHPNSTAGARRAKLGHKESVETKLKKRIAMEQHRESQSARQRSNWEDPAYRERVTENMRKRWQRLKLKM
jgi:hypothetical protein